MKQIAIFDPAPAKGWIPWAFLAPVLCILFVAAPLIAVSTVLEGRGLLDVNDNPVGRPGLMAMLFLPFSAIAAVVLCWVSLVERRSLASIGLTDEAAGATFGGGILIGAITSATVVGAIWSAGGFQVADVAPAFLSGDALLYIAVLLVCFTVQSSVEEILFRGWLLSAIARRFNLVGAMVLVSAVFALLHFHRGQPPLVTLNTFLFSVFACCWALRTGNIWGVMGWHAGWNWLIGTGFELHITGLDLNVPALLVKLIPQGPDDLTGGADGPEGSVFCGLFFAGASALLIASRALLASRAPS